MKTTKHIFVIKIKENRIIKETERQNHNNKKKNKTHKHNENNKNKITDNKTNNGKNKKIKQIIIKEKRKNN